MELTVADLSLSEDQRMLAQSVARYVDQHYAHADWRRIVDAEPGISESRWRDMAKLGWLGLGISESLGGHGGRLADQLMVVQELARGLVSEPVVSTTIVSASRIVLSRCAITSDVRPAMNRRMLVWMARSDSVSSALVASSKIRMGGSL